MYPSRHHPHWDGVFVQGVAWVGLAPHDSSIRTEGEKLGNRETAFRFVETRRDL